MEILDAVEEKLRSDNCSAESGIVFALYSAVYMVPWVLTGIFTLKAIDTQQVHYLLLTIVQWFNLLLILLIVAVFRDPVVLSGCATASALPDAIIEQAFFVYTYLVLARISWGYGVVAWHVFGLQTWVTLAWMVAVAAGFRTIKQAIVSAAIGTAVGVVSNRAVVYIFLRNYDAIMASSFVRWRGLRDTVFRPPAVEPLDGPQRAAVLAVVSAHVEAQHHSHPHGHTSSFRVT